MVGEVASAASHGQTSGNLSGKAGGLPVFWLGLPGWQIWRWVGLGEKQKVWLYPKYLCEFKDIRTSLDKEQFLKGNNRLSDVVYLMRFTLITKLMFNLV